MKIHFFKRQLLPKTISIEKVFYIVKSELIKKNFSVSSFENPFPLSRMLQGMWFFRKNQGDINHITGDIHWACLLLNRNKTVLTIHDNVGVKAYASSWKNKLYLMIWLYLPVWKLKYITVISQKTKDEILNYCPGAEKKIRVIHNPLTSDLFERRAELKEAKDIKILIVGTRANKNIERILTASKNLDCHVTIVGETNAEQNKLISESKAAISITGFITDAELDQLYRTSDILCFPSLYEGFGMPVIEAQASGCAVITSNIEPMISISADAALFVDPLDENDILNKLILLINDLNMRKSLVEKGYINAKRFLPEEITQQYINLYKEIANEARNID